MKSDENVNASRAISAVSICLAVVVVRSPHAAAAFAARPAAAAVSALVLIAYLGCESARCDREKTNEELNSCAAVLVVVEELTPSASTLVHISVEPQQQQQLFHRSPLHHFPCRFGIDEALLAVRPIYAGRV